MWMRIKGWAWPVAVLLFCLLVLFRSANLVEFMAADSWTHVGVGRFVLENRRVPAHADISFKVLGESAEWVSHSWLFDVVSYVIYSSGAVIVVVFLLALWLGTFGLGWLVARRLGVEGRQILGLGIIVALVSGVFWRLHPLVVVPALMLGMYYAYLTWKQEKKHKLWLVPVIFWIWAQVAGGYIFIGLLLIGVCIMLEIGYRISNKIWKAGFLLGKVSIKSLIGWSGLGFVVSCLNPSGIRIWVFLDNLGYLSGANKIYSSLSGVLVAANSNYVRDQLSAYPFVTYLIGVLVLVFVLTWVVVRRGWKGFIQETVLMPLVPILFLGFWWVRFLPVSVFAGVILLVVGGKYLNFDQVGQKKLIQLIEGVAVLVLGVWAVISPPRQVQIVWPKIPISILREWNIEGNLATTPDLSGYAYYYNYPKLGNLDVLDDLFDEYEAINVYSLINAQRNEGYERFFRDQNVNALLFSQNADYLIASASKSKDWSLVYFDDDGFVFVRRDAVSKAFLSSNAFESVSFGRALGFDPEKGQQAVQELSKYIERYPDSVMARGQLATVYRIQKKFDLATQILLQVPDNKWNLSLMVEMARLQSAQGNCTEAEKWYQLLLKSRNETGLSKAVLDLAVLYAGCLNNKPAAEHYFKRYNSYPLPPDERERVRKIAKDFGVALDEADNDNK